MWTIKTRDCGHETWIDRKEGKPRKTTKQNYQSKNVEWWKQKEKLYKKYLRQIRLTCYFVKENPTEKRNEITQQKRKWK